MCVKHDINLLLHNADVRSDKSGPVRKSKRIASQNLKRELEKKNNAGELRGKSQSKTPKKKANIRTTTNALVTPTTRKYKTKGNVLPSYGPGSSKATASSSTARTKSFPPAVHSKRKLDEDYDQVDEDTAANRSIKRRSTNIKNTLAETANEKKVTDKKGSASSESSSKTNTTAKQTKATEKKPTTSTSTNRQRSTRSKSLLFLILIVINKNVYIAFKMRPSFIYFLLHINLQQSSSEILHHILNIKSNFFIAKTL